MAIKISTTNNLFFPGVEPGTIIDDSGNIYLNNLFANSVFLDQPNIGTVAGYSVGGSSSTPAALGSIDKYSFSSDADATDVGEMSSGSFIGSSGASDTSAGLIKTSGDPAVTAVHRFPYAAPPAGTTTYGDVTASISDTQVNYSSTDAFFSGGSTSPSAVNSNIDKISMGGSSPAPSTDVGELTLAVRSASAVSSTTDGYILGGFEASNPSPGGDTIQKFPFSISSGTSTDVGEINNPTFPFAQNQKHRAGWQSHADGFSITGPYTTRQLLKFPFSNPSVTTSLVGDYNGSSPPFTDGTSSTGTSSVSKGYITSDVDNTPPNSSNKIDSFSFYNYSTVTTIGNLSYSYSSRTTGVQD